MNIVKSLLLLSLAFLMTACGETNYQKSVSELNGLLVQEQCHRGVTYLVMASGVTVVYNQDSTVRTCEMNNQPK